MSPEAHYMNYDLLLVDRALIDMPLLVSSMCFVNSASPRCSRTQNYLSCLILDQ